MGLFPLLWAAVAAAVVAVEAGGRLRLFGLAPLGLLLACLRANPWCRGALVIAWMWAGWHVFAR